MAVDRFVAFQAGVAGTCSDVPGAMSQTHDWLIGSYPGVSRSGVGWYVFGPPAALPFVHLRASGGGELAGSLGEGWEVLASLLSESRPDCEDENGEYLRALCACADLQPQPVLVVAYMTVGLSTN